MVGSIITLLYRASSKFRLIYCFFLVKSWFFIEKVQDVGKLGCRIAQVPLFLWNHFVNFNQALPKCSLGDPFQSYVRYVWDPKNGPRGGLKWLIILIFKNLLIVNQQCQKIDTWHKTLINLENRNLVWPNDFDLQLGCCISDAFSIFFSQHCICSKIFLILGTLI